MFGKHFLPDYGLFFIFLSEFLINELLILLIDKLCMLHFELIFMYSVMYTWKLMLFVLFFSVNIQLFQQQLL
jgi:hypothetical protein